MVKISSNAPLLILMLFSLLAANGCGLAAELAARTTTVEIMPLDSAEIHAMPTVRLSPVTLAAVDVTPLPTPTATSAVFPVESAEWLLPDAILWRSGAETGDLSEWQADQSENAIVNTGTGRVEVTDDIARTGNYGLKLSIDDASNQTQAARIFRWAEDTPAAYYSAWFYLPIDVTPDAWWNILQFESGTNASMPTWIVNIGETDQGDLYLYLWDDITDTPHYRPLPQQAMPFPISQWVHIEAFVQQSQDKTGQIILWQDGVRLYDVQNVQTTLADNLDWSINNYTDNIIPASVSIYIDDAMIALHRRGINQ